MTPSSKSNESGTFSAQEREAMKARAAELKASAKSGKAADKAAVDAAAVQQKIAEMQSPDREMAEQLHDLILAAVPDLTPRLWYGAPAYAKDGKVVVFFRSGLGDKERYSTLGFSSAAAFDQASGLWPTSYALSELTKDAAEQITKLVTRAVG